MRENVAVISAITLPALVRDVDGANLVEQLRLEQTLPRAPLLPEQK